MKNRIFFSQFLRSFFESLKSFRSALQQTANDRKCPRDHVNPSFAARCFQFLSKIEPFCVSIKGQIYSALFSSVFLFFQENISVNLAFAVNAILLFRQTGLVSSHRESCLAINAKGQIPY